MDKVENKKNKKSQITLFIIIALVLFIIIGLFFYLSKYSVKKQIGDRTTKMHKIKIELQPIESYVTQCLDKTAKEGLILLGKQGGYLFKSQGGFLIDYRDNDEGSFFVNYDGYKVSYGIYPLRFDTGIYYSTAPNYPWTRFPEQEGIETFKGLFGISNLPPINSSFGANSIKSQLEFYIKNNMRKCIDWSIFEEQDYEITENELNAKLGIAKEDLTIHLIYPLTIKNKLSGDTTTMQDFFVREKIRLNQIYEFTYDIIDKDIKDIKFDMGTASRDGLSVDVRRDVFDKDDVIVVRDVKSLINNIPYEFIFARHNRMPALYYITPTEIILPIPSQITDTHLIQGGISSLKAEDPDEDLYYFSIEPNVPMRLSANKEFKIKVTDGKLEDYQVITVSRN